MNSGSWTNIDRYYEDLFLPSDKRLDLIEKTVQEAGLPDIAISPLYGRLMEIIIRSAEIHHVLEIGTLGGYSTAWLARGLPPDGLLISLEIDPVRAKLARQNLKAFPFQDQVEIREGDALQLMSEMIESGHSPFDLVFIDGEKSQYPEYLELSIQLSRPGTLMIADNVIKHGPVFNDVIDTPDRKGITSFHEKAAADHRLDTVILQTVGRKGHDGLAFIIVKDPAGSSQ